MKKEIKPCPRYSKGADCAVPEKNGGKDVGCNCGTYACMIFGSVTDSLAKKEMDKEKK
jgi:hypothetical protein